MCLRNIKKSKIKLRFGYKIFSINEKGEVFAYHSHQPFKNSTKIWQGAMWKTLDEVNSCSGVNHVFVDSSHLNKLSVMIHKNQAMNTFIYDERQVWKVEVKYKKLLVGDWEGDKCALVDEIRLIERVK